MTMKFRMLLILSIVLAMVLSSPRPAVAQVETLTAKTGNWDDPGTWMIGGMPAGRTPAGDDNVIIPAGATVDVVGNKRMCCLQVQRGGKLVGSGYAINAATDIEIRGTVETPARLIAGRDINVHGVLVEGNFDGLVLSDPGPLTPGPNALEITAGGDIGFNVEGRVLPKTGVAIPAGFNGKPTKIISNGGDVRLGSGATGAAIVAGTPGGAGGNGADVLVEVKAGMGIIKDPRATIRGGAGARRGNVTLKSQGIVRSVGPNTDVIGGTVEIFALGRQIGGPTARVLTGLDTGDIKAEDGSVIIATCSGFAVDLRGNTEPHVIMAAQSVIIETSSIFIDPGVLLSELTSPPAITPPPHRTSLRDLNGNGIADFCEENVVNDMVSLAAARLLRLAPIQLLMPQQEHSSLRRFSPIPVPLL
jgi:hypothetical protein